MMRQTTIQRRACLVILICLICLALTGCNAQDNSYVPCEEDLCTVTGRYIRGRNDQNMILIEEKYGGMVASYMGNSTGDETIFDEFQTGDRIRIVCNNFRETSPMQTDVFECEWLESGSIKDIPQEHIEHLTLMGQMDEPITVTFDWHYEGKEVHIQATYGALWTYSEVKPHMSEASNVTQIMGLHLHLFHESNVVVDVLYYPEGFGLCGTGMTIQEVELDDGNAATLYREEHENGSVTGYLCFHENEGLEGSVVARYHLEKKWLQYYEEDIQEIMKTITFSVP